MKRKKLLAGDPYEMPADIPEEEVIAASQIVEDALEIDLFYGGHLAARYFTDKKTYGTWIGGEWHEYKLDNAVRACRGMVPDGYDLCYYSGIFNWASKKDRKRAEDWADGPTSWMENDIRADRRERARERRAERIDAEMAQVPSVPDGVEEWLAQEIFPGDYLFTWVSGKRVNYSCTVCGRDGWKKTRPKHGTKIRCPKCGAEVTVNNRQDIRTRKDWVIVLQGYVRREEKKMAGIRMPITEPVWVEQQFRAVCTWQRGEKKTIRLNEEVRAVIPMGQRWGKVYYGIQGDADEFEQDFWDKNPYSKHFRPSYLYPGNLQEVLPYGKLEHSGLDLLTGQKMPANLFVTNYSEWPWLEYLAKAGLGKLAADLLEKYHWSWTEPKEIDQTAHTLKDLLRLDGNRTNRLKCLRGGLNTLRWLQYEQREGIRISQESLEFLDKHDLPRDSTEELMRELGSVNRTVNYMKKQRTNPKDLVFTWRDYLRMAQDEGMDTSDDIVRFPRDLKLRHDQLVERINQRTMEEKLKADAEKHARMNKQIQSRLPEVRRYYYEDENYIVVPAARCEELVREGQTLHHCVGASDNYMRRMAEGRTWILFLRKKEDIETPYYTIEINLEDDRILQYYSAYDRQPDKEQIDAFLEKYKRIIANRRIQAKTAQKEDVMDYVQMTLDDWLQIKEDLKQELQGIQASFVRIGYKLRQIEERKLYEQDGYKSIADFAKAEYNLSASTVSRFIAINRKFSVGGNSDRIDPELAALGFSKLSEMLSLPDSDLEMIRPEATREGIRELKTFNREEPTAGEADDLSDLIEKFFGENRNLLTELFRAGAIHDEKQAIEIINPSGNKVFRKGLYFMVMYETEIKIKKFRQDPEALTWTKFLDLTEKLFGESWNQYEETNSDDTAKTGEKTVENVRNSHVEEDTAGEPEPVPAGTNAEETSAGDAAEETEAAGDTEEDTLEEPDTAGGPEEITADEPEPVAEAHPTTWENDDPGKSVDGSHEKSGEKTFPNSGESDIPGKPADEPEETKEEAPDLSEYMNPPEPSEEIYGIREDYICDYAGCGADSNVAWRVICYLAQEYREGRFDPSILANDEALRAWINEDVDHYGRPRSR